MNAPQKIILVLLRVYRVLISPFLGALCAPFGFGCRFQPTCSCYAAEAVASHGAWKGCCLALRRLGRCHPWGGSGYDSVPKLNLPSTTRSSALICQTRTTLNHLTSPVKSA